MPMTARTLLDAATVAWWNETMQLYCCLTCRANSMMMQWQRVTADDANALAKDLGKSHCDVCGRVIGHDVQE